MILPPRREARNASGDGYSGAKLTIYEAGTTTPASIYSDANLTTPLANPVTADSGGVFPAIYAAEGATFDIICKTAGGTTLYTEDDVPALGGDGVSLARDFGNSRFQVYGSGGTVYMEAGDASPDNSGGTMQISGYDSTSGDSLTVKFDSVTFTGDVDVTGALTVTGATGDFAAGGRLYANTDNAVDEVLSSGTFTGASTVEIELTGSLRHYRIEFADLRIASTSSANLRMLVAFDSTPTYKTTSGDYAYGYYYVDHSAISAVSGASPATYIELCALSYSAGSAGSSGYVDIFTSSGSTQASGIEAVINVCTNTSAVGLRSYRASGQTKPGYGQITWVKFFPSANTITGRWRLISGYGL